MAFVIRTEVACLLLPAALALCAAGCQPAAAPPPPGRADMTDRLRLLEEPQFACHTVAKGDTLYGLARRYGVPVAAISAANPGLDPRKLLVGAKVMIPGAAPAGATAPPAPTPGPKPPAVRTADRGGKFCDPVVGKSTETSSPVPGVVFAARPGATVVSAAAGTVVLAAPDLAGGGPAVIVDHGDGLCTLYGQLSDYAVSPGQKLSRGEALGRAGAGGLLFRVYEGAEAKAPRPYLSR